MQTESINYAVVVLSLPRRVIVEVRGPYRRYERAQLEAVRLRDIWPESSEQEVVTVCTMTKGRR